MRIFYTYKFLERKNNEMLVLKQTFTKFVPVFPNFIVKSDPYSIIL